MKQSDTLRSGKIAKTLKKNQNLHKEQNDIKFNVNLNAVNHIVKLYVRMSNAFY